MKIIIEDTDLDAWIPFITAQVFSLVQMPLLLLFIIRRKESEKVKQQPPKKLQFHEKSENDIEMQERNQGLQFHKEFSEYEFESSVDQKNGRNSFDNFFDIS